jgi:glutamyl-tRNA reductase
VDTEIGALPIFQLFNLGNIEEVIGRNLDGCYEEVTVAKMIIENEVGKIKCSESSLIA